MADNFPITPGSGRNAATDQVTHSGDTADVQLVRPVLVSGSEGSKTVVDLPGDATNGLLVNLGSNNDVTVTSGTVAATQSGTWNVGTVTTITNVVHVDDNSSSITVDGTVGISGNVDVTPSSPTANDYLPVRLTDGSSFYSASGGGGTEYTEGDTDATITGTAILWENTSNTLATVSSSTPLPIGDAGGSITVDYATTGSGTATGALRVELPTNGTGVIATVGAVTAITNALPAGTNAIGKLAANSGVDIGDVDVTSVVPGTGATNLGKAEDAAHGSGDVGVMALAVRADTAAATGADGDYVPLLVDSTGKLHVNVGNTVTVGSHAVTNAGTFVVQENGAALTSLQLIDDAVATTGSAITTKGIAVSGTDGTNARVIKTDSSGELQVDVLTLPNVTLAAGTNTNEVVGDVAHDAAVAGNPVLIGAEARATLGTAVATGDAVRIAANRYGMLLQTAMIPSRASSNGTPITSTTTSVVAAPSSGNHLRIVRIHMSNGGSTATWVAVRDGAAGTQYYRTYLPQGGAMSLNLNYSGPLDLTTATRLDIVLSAAGSVEYCIDHYTVAD